ncbi:MAG: DnaD domain protein [Bacilli bacterium]|jgi:DNA replication protein|nr:DnaD domain protein [Bacilli bacterium]
MSNSLPNESVDFRYLLLEYYKKLGLTENEVLVLLMVNHLLNQKNDWITADMLSLKTNLKTKELDRILSDLVKRGFLEYVLESARVSLEPISKTLWQLFALDVAKNNQNRLSAERAELLSEIYSYYEKKLGRTLSPFDKDQINQWLDDGYRVEQIRHALDDALAEGRKTMKSVGKRLRLARAGEDIDREGYTLVGDNWDQDIAKTMEIVKTKWVDDGKED